MNTVVGSIHRIREVLACARFFAHAFPGLAEYLTNLVDRDRIPCDGAPRAARRKQVPAVLHSSSHQR